MYRCMLSKELFFSSAHPQELIENVDEIIFFSLFYVCTFVYLNNNTTHDIDFTISKSTAKIPTCSFHVGGEAILDLFGKNSVYFINLHSPINIGLSMASTLVNYCNNDIIQTIISNCFYLSINTHAKR